MKGWAVVSAVLVMGTARSAYAVAGVGDEVHDLLAEGFLAKQLTLMTEAGVNNVKEVTALSQALVFLKSMLQTANETASGVRFLAGVYNAIKNFSPAEAERAVMVGLNQQLPELASLINQTQQVVWNAETIGQGKFFQSTDPMDQTNQAIIANVATAELMGTTYSKIAPILFQPKSLGQITEADQLVLGRMLRKGMLGQESAKATAFKAKTDQNEQLKQAALGSNQITAIMQAVGLGDLDEMAKNMDRMTSLQVMNTADQEAAERKANAANTQLFGEVGAGLQGGAFSIGPCWPPPCGRFDASSPGIPAPPPVPVPVQ